MKKWNALTLSFLFGVSVAVALAGFIASRPLASVDATQAMPAASGMSVPF